MTNLAASETISNFADPTKYDVSEDRNKIIKEGIFSGEFSGIKAISYPKKSSI